MTVAAKLSFMKQEMGTWPLQRRTRHVLNMFVWCYCYRCCCCTYHRGGGDVVSLFVAREARRAMPKRRSTLTHDSVFIYIL